MPLPCSTRAILEFPTPMFPTQALACSGTPTAETGASFWEFATRSELCTSLERASLLGTMKLSAHQICYALEKFVCVLVASQVSLSGSH